MSVGVGWLNVLVAALAAGATAAMRPVTSEAVRMAGRRVMAVSVATAVRAVVSSGCSTPADRR
jgi:hypothetical protein